MAKLTLLINDNIIAFSKASISFSVESLAHSFSATLDNVNITEPLPIKFALDGELIFNGQIDGIADDVSGTSDQIVITGRSLSANLIDSRIKLNALYNQKLDQLLEVVVTPFGLTVSSDTDTLPLIPEFQINAESPVDNLAQIAKQQNLMLIERNGEIVIQEPGQQHEQNITLEVGKNIENLSTNRNFQDQFYHYEIQGAYDEAEAIELDESIHSSRIKVIIADKLHSVESCKTRALYEKNLAIAKGLYATASMPGLHSLLTGKSINKTLLVKNERKAFSEVLLIKSISISVDDKSENTSVELFRPLGG